MRHIALTCATLIAGDQWTTEQRYAQAAYLSMTTMDMLQTLEFRRHGRTESNPLLGREPSRAKVVLGVTACMALHTLITDALPSRYRKYWQYAWIAVELDAVAHNWRAGFRVVF
jgi:hypothetical protein